MTRNRRAELHPWEADLAAARSVDVRYDVARGAARLSATLAVASGASVASASAAGALGKGVTQGIAGKALGMLALTGALVTVEGHAPIVPREDHRIVLAASTQTSDALAAERVAPRPAGGVPIAPRVTAEPPTPRAQRAPASVRPKRGDRFAGELADVAHARALLSGDPAAALAAAERPQASQALAEEREIIAIRALIALGRKAEAQGRARDFVARRPQSPFVAMARGLLAE